MRGVRTLWPVVINPFRQQAIDIIGCHVAVIKHQSHVVDTDDHRMGHSGHFVGINFLGQVAGILGGDDGRFERGERVDLRKINAQSDKLSSNPFAQFFKQDDGPPKEPTTTKKKGPKGKKPDAGPDPAAAQEPAALEQAPPTTGAQPQGSETPGEE